MASDIDICFLQETFLKPKIQARLANYQLFRTDRVGASRGGVEVAVRNTIPAVSVPFSVLRQDGGRLEVTVVMVNLGGSHRLFCLSVYNRNDRRRISPELAALFEKLCLDRPEHHYVVGATSMRSIRTGGFGTPPRGGMNSATSFLPTDPLSVAAFSRLRCLHGHRRTVSLISSSSTIRWTCPRSKTMT